MNASRYIGRIGGLAVALGVGAALFTGNGIAWAGPDSQDSSVSSTSGPPASDASDSKPVKKTPAGPFGRIKTSTPSGSTPASTSQGDEGSSRTGRKTLADILGAHRSASTPTPQSASGTSGSTSTSQQPKKNRLRSSLTDLRPQGSLPASTISAKGANDVVVKTQSTLTSLLKPSVVVPQIASTPSTLPLVSIVKNSLVTRSAMVTPQSATPDAAQPAHSVSNVLVTVVNRILRPSAGTTPTAPPVDQPATLVLLAALRRGLSGAVDNLDQPSPIRVSPTLVLDGYNLVPSGEDPTEYVSSFYGLFNDPPGTPGVVQGTQKFDVVDPDTGVTVGTVETLVSNTNSFVIGGGTFHEIVVTSADAGGNLPVGSLLTTINIGHWGIYYSVIPSAPGDEITFKLLTPIVDIPIPTNYNAATVLTSVSRPVLVSDQYYIAPATNSETGSAEPEKLTSITGVPPLFVAAQGEQLFSVYDANTGASVGTFRGLVTTTSDIAGNSSEAILVTEVVSGTQGTNPGDVPPVGSVYNVIYHDQLAPPPLCTALGFRHSDHGQLGDTIQNVRHSHQI